LPDDFGGSHSFNAFDLSLCDTGLQNSGQILPKTGKMIHAKMRHLRNKRKRSMKELK